MDAKTLTDIEKSLISWHEPCNEIVNSLVAHIQQQAKRIEELKIANELLKSAIIDCENCVTNNELSKKIRQLEKYAELGKLALKAHLEDKQNAKNREEGIDSHNITAYFEYLGAMNIILRELLAEEGNGDA